MVRGYAHAAKETGAPGVAVERRGVLADGPAHGGAQLAYVNGDFVANHPSREESQGDFPAAYH